MVAILNWERGGATSAVLSHGYTGQLPGSPMLIYVCCVQHFVLLFNTNFVGSTNTINIRFNFIDNLDFYSCEWLCR